MQGETLKLINICWRFIVACCLHFQSAHTLRMEAATLSETSINILKSTWRHTPE